jgi:leucine efflux protein
MVEQLGTPAPASFCLMLVGHNMLGVEHLLAFLLAATLVILVPGPATLYVAGRAQGSTLSGCRAMLGIVAGDVALITLSGLGFAALLVQWPLLLAFVKMGGGLYIAYLALEQLKSTPRGPKLPTDGAPVEVTQGGFVKALLITLTNPKPILFFAAFFPMFIDPAARSTIRSYFLLGAMFELLNLIYFAALIAIVRQLQRTELLGPSNSARLHWLSAIGLLVCSAFVLLS